MMYILLLLGLFQLAAGQATRCSSIGVRFSLSSGVITSPNYPSNYSSNAQCRYFITLPRSSDRIRLRFSTFEVEQCTGCSCDYLRVYDGRDSSAPLRGTFCGPFLPEDILSSTNMLFLEFRSDSGTSHKGWLVVFETAGAGSSTNAAFHARRTLNAGPFSSDRTLIMDRTPLNVGGGYIPATSTFRAPVTGVYSLTWRIAGVRRGNCTDPDQLLCSAGVELQCSGSVVDSGNTFGEKPAGNTAMVRLLAGQLCNLVLKANTATQGSHTAFAGTLIGRTT